VLAPRSSLVRFLTVAVTVGSILALAGGCHRRARAKGPGVAGPARVGAPAAKRRPTPKLDLPNLTAPEALPARRTLHLFHTSNVVGEIEPCG
jgi:hypothetical protein